MIPGTIDRDGCAGALWASHRPSHRLPGRRARGIDGLIVTALTVFVLPSLVSVAAAASMDQRALIEQALDEPTTLKMSNINLATLLEKIAEQTGVRIDIPPDSAALIAHGLDTPIENLEIANEPLRTALTQLFAPLGMKTVVRDDRVEIVPHDALRCLGRPPTWEELDLLEQLRGMRPGTDAASRERLRQFVQFQTPQRNAWTILSEALGDVGAGFGDDVLTVACRQLGWTWCLSGTKIVITPLQADVHRRLQDLVSLRVNHRPLFDVLQAVGDRVGVDIRVEPGVLASLPVHVQQNFSVNVHQRSAEQVLEEICAYTGLGYLIEPDGVLLYQPGMGGEPRAPDTARPAGAPADDPYVAKMVRTLGDGRSVEWLIRRSELPEDLRDMRRRDIEEMIDALRRWEADGNP